jgi:hypothetical protein
MSSENAACQSGESKLKSHVRESNGELQGPQIRLIRSNHDDVSIVIQSSSIYLDFFL